MSFYSRRHVPFYLTNHSFSKVGTSLGRSSVTKLPDPRTQLPLVEFVNRHRLGHLSRRTKSPDLAPSHRDLHGRREKSGGPQKLSLEIASGAYTASMTKSPALNSNHHFHRIGAQIRHPNREGGERDMGAVEAEKGGRGTEKHDGMATP